MVRKLFVALMVAFVSGTATLQSTFAEPAYDLVILSGRIMDPESGTDRIANIGVRDGRIAEISEKSISGKRTIDAKGLVVAPGFIDLHSHAQYALGYDLQARDGVTTSLELEAGVYPVKPFYDQREGHTRINFGASVGLQSIRVKIKTGIEDPQSPQAPFMHWADVLPRKAEWAESKLSSQEREEEGRLFEKGFAEGGLGLGVLYEYLPGMGRDELYEVLKVAGRLTAPVFVHARSAELSDPDHLMAPMQELIADSAATGAPIHICHIGSKGQGSVGLLLDLIDNARKRGVDVTTEVYPYDAGSTAIGSALFNPGWQEHLGAKFEDIEWPLTGERMSAESFARFRAESPGSAVILHIIPDASVTEAVAHRGVMIASDAVPFVNGAGHPRGTGTFARVLGVYVREKHALSLMDAIGKMSLLPAQRLESMAPSMRNKGRVKVGADADLTLFDPATVIDKATYRNPTEPSQGIQYVLVAGVPVVDHGEIVPSVFLGRGIRSGVASSN